MASLSVREFKSALKSLEGVYSDAGSSSPKSSLNRIIKLIDSTNAATLDELVRVLREKRKSSGRSATSESLRTSVVERHTRALASAGHDRSLFMAALESLKVDKTVRAVELAAIANGYMGTSERFKTKAHAYDAILETYRYRASTQRNVEIAANARPW